MPKFILIPMATMTISCNAQESLILEKNKIKWTDYKGLYSDYGKGEYLEKFHFLKNVDLYEITYLSDGLKIQSFAAVP